MRSKRLFHDIYVNLSTGRIILVFTLFIIVLGILFYFNDLRKKLEDREEKYTRLYAESISFYIEKALDSSCDYTFVQEVLEANETIPAILVTNGSPMNYMNIPELEDSTITWDAKVKEKFLYSKIAQMAEEHTPIEFKIEGSRGYLYYSNSTIVKQLRYFPYILLTTFGVFSLLAFLAYSSSRKAEQNRVWVGLAKETAHQLGTPISGLLGWIEVLKINPEFDQSIGEEMLKDVKRLETITSRFSNIGSEPSMKPEDLGEILESTIDYLKIRISTKIQWQFTNNLSSPYIKKVNRNLIEWVIENVCKNAVDAMIGVGFLKILIENNPKGGIFIDIIDSGKGMNSKIQRRIFKPGFSTKKRGWGLGLTLAKRIIETYHDGQIYVLESIPNKGTTFRIEL